MAVVVGLNIAIPLELDATFELTIFFFSIRLWSSVLVVLLQITWRLYVCISLYYRFTSTLIQLRVQLASTRIDTAALGRNAASAKPMPNTWRCTARNLVANAESSKGKILKTMDGWWDCVSSTWLSLDGLVVLFPFHMSLTMSVLPRIVLNGNQSTSLQIKGSRGQQWRINNYPRFSSFIGAYADLKWPERGKDSMN